MVSTHPEAVEYSAPYRYDADPEPQRVAEVILRCELLVSRRHDASEIELASTILSAYADFDGAERTGFFRTLLIDFGPDQPQLQQSARAYADDPSPTTAAALQSAAEPRRQELFRRLNTATGGTAAIVRMRADLLERLGEFPALDAVDRDLVHLLASWFNRGFLVPRAIDWSTPTTILEQIMRCEAVHEIGGWEELRDRLEPDDRRCFGFFHPRMPDEPLIFVEVALLRGISSSIGEILARDRDAVPSDTATTAVFYSISNCQAGLRGVPLGDFLITQAIAALSHELPNVKRFVTLSPVPGFRGWLATQGAGFADLLRPGRWMDSAADVALSRAVANYLLRVRDRDGRPADAVARFHLGNGARLEQINLRADRSERGIDQSLGVMVNYLYDAATAEHHREIFATSGRVAASKSVRALLESSPSEEGRDSA